MQLQTTPKTVSMFELKNHTADVTRKAAESPVFIMNRSTPQGVFISPDLWDALVERIADLEDSLAATQAELDVAEGRDTVRTITDPAAFIEEVMHGDAIPA